MPGSRTARVAREDLAHRWRPRDEEGEAATFYFLESFFGHPDDD